jgi:hypothetical protein
MFYRSSDVVPILLTSFALLSPFLFYFLCLNLFLCNLCNLVNCVSA